MEVYEVGPYRFTKEEELYFGIPRFVWRIEIEEQRTHHFALSLEEAMATAIAFKFDGRNTRAHEYFLRGLLPAEMMEHYK